MKHCLGLFFFFAGLATATAASAQCLPPVDSDGDGVTNDVDFDDDNDGVSDVFELNGWDYSFDRDCDSIRDYEDADLASVSMPRPTGCADADADGRCDGGLGVAYDDDRDGVPNHIDLDADNDGIPDSREAIGTQSLSVADTNSDGRLDSFADTNHNGIDDRVEPNGIDPSDTDNEGVSDPYESDSDGDAIFDVSEGGGTDWACSGRPRATFNTSWDSNGNGLADELEPAMGGTPLSLPDTDGDGSPDYVDLDSDGDSKPDATEHGMKFCTILTDSDGDGISDFRDANDAQMPLEQPVDPAVNPAVGSGGDEVVPDAGEETGEDDPAPNPDDTRRGCDAVGQTSVAWLFLGVCAAWLARFRRKL